MALITLPVGVNLLYWTGPTTTLSTAPWFSPGNLTGIFQPSANRQGYISSKPGAAYPAFTQLLAPVTGQIPQAYIFVITTAFQLDDSLVGLVPATTPTPAPSTYELYATMPAGSNNMSVPLSLATAAQVGTYVLNANLPATGFSSLAYKKNGTAITLSTTTGVALTLGDVLSLTGITPAGTTGKVYFIKQ